jgi:hypothetical protein
VWASFISSSYVVIRSNGPALFAGVDGAPVTGKVGLIDDPFFCTKEVRSWILSGEVPKCLMHRAAMDGSHLLIESIQWSWVDKGTTIREGKGHPLVNVRTSKICARSASDCTVLPSPISSARTQFRLYLSREINHCNPFFWKSLSSTFCRIVSWGTMPTSKLARASSLRTSLMCDTYAAVWRSSVFMRSFLSSDDKAC